MADEFGQRIQGLHQVGDSVVSTDKHVAVLAEDDSNTYQYLQLDSSGNLKVTSTGGGATQYQVDDAAGATDFGNVALVVRVDTPATLTPADGDYTRLQVDSTGQLWVTATDLDIRDLTAASDSVAISDGTNTLTVDASGYLTANINGDVNVTQGTDPWVVSATDLDIRTLDSETPGDNVYVKSSTGNELAIDASGNLSSLITDGTDTLAINTDGSINVVSSESALDSVYTYGSANLVKDTETTVVTRAAAADEGYSGVMVSGAGYCEWAVKFGTTGSEAVILQFWTTPSNPTQYVDLPDYLEVSSGETLLITGTNREKAASPGSDFTGHASLIRKV